MDSAKPIQKPVQKWIKLTLDAILLVLLALMYRKNAISMSFHEIGGLALIGLFVVHHLFNGAWILAVTPRAFRKGVPGKTRLQFVLGVLLLLSVLAVGVSGALISKTVFSFRAGGAWKTIHYFSAALTVVLGGVHAGLHASYLFGFLKRKARPMRAIAAIVLAAVLLFGGYSLATTSFMMWLTMPFSASASFAGGEGPGLHDGTGPQPDASGVEPARPSDADAAAADSERPSGAGQGRGQGNGQGRGQGKQDGSGRGGQSGGVGSALTTVMQFVSMTAVFAALTAGVEALLKKRRRHPAAAE